MSKTHAMSYRLTDTAKERMIIFCEMTGMKPSEVARAAISHFIAPTLQNAEIMQTSIPSRTRVPDIECVNTHSASDLAINEWHTFFKAFWEVVTRRQFPKRVAHLIRENWSAYSHLDPAKLGALYNDYCGAQAAAGREFCHPNSWLAAGGYENEIVKAEPEPDTPPQQDGTLNAPPLSLSDPLA